MKYSIYILKIEFPFYYFKDFPLLCSNMFKCWYNCYLLNYNQHNIILQPLEHIKVYWFQFVKVSWIYSCLLCSLYNYVKFKNKIKLERKKRKKILIQKTWVGAQTSIFSKSFRCYTNEAFWWKLLLVSGFHQMLLNGFLFNNLFPHKHISISFSEYRNLKTLSY